jgi:hypothetical protein
MPQLHTKTCAGKYHIHFWNYILLSMTFATCVYGFYW